MGLRHVLSAALPASQAPRRERTEGHDRVGPRTVEEMAAGAQRLLDRAEQPVSHRQYHHDRRLLRRRAGDARRAAPLRPDALSERYALARQHEEAEGLATGERALRG